MRRCGWFTVRLLWTQSWAAEEYQPAEAYFDAAGQTRLYRKAVQANCRAVVFWQDGRGLASPQGNLWLASGRLEFCPALQMQLSKSMLPAAGWQVDQLAVRQLQFYA